MLVLPVTNFISVPHTYFLHLELRFEIRIVEDWQITILIETYNLQPSSKSELIALEVKTKQNRKISSEILAKNLMRSELDFPTC